MTPRSMPTSKQPTNDFYVPDGESKPLRANGRKTASKSISSPKEHPEPIRRSAKAEADPFIPSKMVGGSKLKPGLTSDKENERVKKEIAKIDAMEMSDVETSEFEAAKQEHVQLSQKRQRDVEVGEIIKRKVGHMQSIHQRKWNTDTTT